MTPVVWFQLGDFSDPILQAVIAADHRVGLDGTHLLGPDGASIAENQGFRLPGARLSLQPESREPESCRGLR